MEYMTGVGHSAIAAGECTDVRKRMRPKSETDASASAQVHRQDVAVLVFLML